MKSALHATPYFVRPAWSFHQWIDDRFWGVWRANRVRGSATIQASAGDQACTVAGASSHEEGPSRSRRAAIGAKEIPIGC